MSVLLQRKDIWTWRPHTRGERRANTKAEIYKPGTVREHHQQLGEEQEADSPSASEGTSPGMP